MTGLFQRSPDAAAARKVRGEYLRKAREAARLTVPQLVQQASLNNGPPITANQIYSFEYGKAGLSSEIAAVLAEVLNIKAADLTDQPDLTRNRLFAEGFAFALIHVLINVADAIHEELSALGVELELEVEPENHLGLDAEPERTLDSDEWRPSMSAVMAASAPERLLGKAIADSFKSLFAKVNLLNEIMKEHYAQRIAPEVDGLEVQLRDVQRVLNEEKRRLIKALAAFRQIDRGPSDPLRRQTGQLALIVAVRHSRSNLAVAEIMLRESIDRSKIFRDKVQGNDGGGLFASRSLVAEPPDEFRERAIRQRLSRVLADLEELLLEFAEHGGLPFLAASLSLAGPLGSGTVKPEDIATPLEVEKFAQMSWRVCALSQEALLRIAGLNSRSEDSAIKALNHMTHFVQMATDVIDRIANVEPENSEFRYKITTARDHVKRRIPEVKRIIARRQGKELNETVQGNSAM